MLQHRSTTVDRVRGARFVADASHALAESLDYQTTLITIAQRTVPALADCCMIYLVCDDGSIERAAMAHRDPDRLEQMSAILERFTVRLDAPIGTSKVLRTGKSELITEITDDMLTEVARDARHLQFLREEGVRSMMSVPLTARGRTLGALTLLAKHELRRYESEDLALAEELAGHAALAVDNARLYHAACVAKVEAEAALAARERADRLIEAVLDHAPGLISVKDTAGRYLVVNRRFEALLGRPMIGRDDTALFSPERARALTADDARVLSTRIPLEVEEVLALGNGDHTYLSTKFPLLDAAGTPLAVCTFSTDITQRRALEDELARAQRMDAVGRLAGGVAHEFNNILTTIRGYSELLAADLGGQNLRGHAEAISRATIRAAALTERLRGFSRAPTNRTEIIDLVQLIAGLEHVLRSSLDRARLVLDVGVEPALVEGDAGELEQIVLDLVFNARDAVGAGGEVRVAIARDAADAPFVHLSVADTGHGMDAATRARVFEPFFTTRELGQGTGLGLFTVYSTVTRYEGRIEVRSAPGAGAVFDVFLPRVQRPALVSTRGARILVVEDDADVRNVLQHALRHSGYDVVAAANGVAALRVLAEEDRPIHLVLTDVIMPDLNGCELAARMAERHPGVRVLFLSGYTGNLLERYAVPADDVLAKPISIEELRDRVQRALAAPPPRRSYQPPVGER